MKRFTYFVMIMLGAGLLLTSCNQAKKSKKEEEGTKVPETVQKAFHSMFAEAKNIKWDSDEEGVFEAEFTLNNTNMSAEFTKDGTWKETEKVVTQSDLSKAIVDSLNAKYPDYTIKKTELTSTPEGKNWEVKLKKDSSEIELILNENGKVLKQEGKEKKEEVGESAEHHEKGEKEEKEEK